MDKQIPLVNLAGRFKGQTQHLIRIGLARRGLRVSSGFARRAHATLLGQNASPAIERRAKDAGQILLHQEHLDMLWRGDAWGDVLTSVLLEPGGEHSANEILAQLRGLVHEPPSLEAWRRICATLERCPGGALGTALEYLQPYLRQWPVYSQEPIFGHYLETPLQPVLAAPRSWLALLRHGQHPLMQALPHLYFDQTEGWNSQDALRALKEHTWPNLRALSFRHLNLTRQHLDALGQGTRLTHLEQLGHIHGQDALETLEHPALEHLEHLSFLTTHSQEPEWLRAPLIQQLQSLHLASFSTSPAAIYPELGHLRHLVLEQGMRYDHEGRCALGQPWPHLESLYLRAHKIGREGLTHLLRNTSLIKLRSLRLPECAAGPRALSHLAQAHHLSLHTLDLDKGNLQDQDALTLAQAPGLARLQHLSLSYNRVTGQGLRWLAQAPFARTLRTLRLDGGRHGDELALVLRDHWRGARLESLSLHYTQLGEEGARALLQIPWLPLLRHLDLSSNDLSPETQQALRQALPDTFLGTFPQWLHQRVQGQAP